MAEFVQRCKERVLKFARIQTEQSIRLGQWMDWDDSYYTMSDENNYTIWRMLKVCQERGWLYRGHDVMPWCPRCGTGISQMEIDTEGYQDVTHTTLYVSLPLRDRPDQSLLVWTTTPWTLPANVAAAVQPELTYAEATHDGETVILAEPLVASVLGPGWEVDAARARQRAGRPRAIAARSTSCRPRRASSTASSRGTTSARRRAPASSTSPPAAAKRIFS